MTPGDLLEQLDQHNEKHDSAHRRLRSDLRLMEARVFTLEGTQAGHTTHLSRISETPVDVAKLRFTPQIVVMMVTSFLTVAGGMWASTYGLRSDVRDILTRMQFETQRQDDRYNTMRTALEDMKRQRESDKAEAKATLAKYEMQEMVKDNIAKPGAKK